MRITVVGCGYVGLVSGTCTVGRVADVARDIRQLLTRPQVPAYSLLEPAIEQRLGWISAGPACNGKNIAVARVFQIQMVDNRKFC